MLSFARFVSAWILSSRLNLFGGRFTFGKAVLLLYGWVAYFLFVRSILYLIGFLGNVVVPKSVDSGSSESPVTAGLVNLSLMMLFVIPHSLLARPSVKRWLAGNLPEAAERSTYVLIASLTLLLLMWQWRPLPEVLWSVEQAHWKLLVLSLFGAGWLIGTAASFQIGHLDLYGLKQVLAYARDERYVPPNLITNRLYRFLRHPMYFGFMLGAWMTPTMSLGHLLFALTMTGYVLIGMRLEERDLLRRFGSTYLTYKRQVPALLPLPSLARAKLPTGRRSR